MNADPVGHTVEGRAAMRDVAGRVRFSRINPAMRRGRGYHRSKSSPQRSSSIIGRVCTAMTWFMYACAAEAPTQAFLS